MTKEKPTRAGTRTFDGDGVECVKIYGSKER